MGFWGNLIDNLMGLKVHDNCTKNEPMTEEEEMETIFYLNMQAEKKQQEKNKNKGK